MENIHDTLTIYHTNDLHGELGNQLSSKNGLSFIKGKLSQNEDSGLMLDAGDFLSGTGDLSADKKMIGTMNNTGYHIATLGNKELENGEEYLSDLISFMNFNLVNCNYSFNNSSLTSKVNPYVIFKSGRMKIGVTGVGAELTNNSIHFNNPYTSATKVATLLKNEKQCDIVICLSHLGMNSMGFNNKDFAAASENIDIIIGGHGENAQLNPYVLRNKLKEQVILRQGLSNGSMLGKMTFKHNDQKEVRAVDFRKFLSAPKASVESIVQA
ncbi:Trifunctional nucleotide phosphoesterase protein YfkN precursor [compost metagenome]